MIRPTAAPVRLDPLSYETLRQQILRRDGWRCQSCGAMSILEVHLTKNSAAIPGPTSRKT
jgi:hypothetical protein